LKSQMMEEFVDRLRKDFDLIIFDSPPVLPVADALILASRLDGILFVADLGRTPREIIRQSQEQLSKLDVPVLGLVCNRVGLAKYDSYYSYKSPARSGVGS